MKAFIVIATKGRPKETYELFNSLAAQTYPIEHIVVMGSDSEDVVALDMHSLCQEKKVTIDLTKAGLTTQRNAGLDYIKHQYQHKLDAKEWVVVFFDDDFRLAPNWLAECITAFESNPNLIGAGGCVLADGIKIMHGYQEQDAIAFLEGKTRPKRHVWSGRTSRPVHDLYGCNMAYRGTFALHERFDENLPYYGWLEDVDYSVRASKKGELRYLPNAKGVHLGVQGGRTSGVRFGYSQIANTLYLYQKETVALRKIVFLVARNILSNTVRTITFRTKKDYRGRLYGNALAMIDLLKSKCHPMNVIDL
jgi:GT2 family glycosyltransferase